MERQEIQLTFGVVVIETDRIGDDILIKVYGGDRPHIGTVVVALPRPSLRGDGSMSATSSVINLVGHKDEALLREIAENKSKQTGAVVVCTGGFHIDGITPLQIKELQEKVHDVFVMEG